MSDRCYPTMSLVRPSREQEPWPPGDESTESDPVRELAEKEAAVIAAVVDPAFISWLEARLSPITHEAVHALRALRAAKETR